MAFVTIESGQVDANSPVDAALMGTIKDNLDDLDSRAVDNGNSHDHIGGDGGSLSTGAFTNGSVTLAKLKWGNGSFTTGSSSASFSINRYSQALAIRAYSYDSAYPNYATITQQSSTANNSDTGRQERYILTNSDTTGTNESTAYWDYHTT